MFGVGHLTAARELMRSFSQPYDDVVETDVEVLQRRLDQQNLVIQTLLALLLEKGVVKEDEFREWVKRMDQLDGARDGKLAEDRSEAPCPSCGKPNVRTASKCRHCGEELEPDLVPPRP